MLTKSLLIALLAACGSNSTYPNPGDKQPPETPPEADHYFCCHDVDPAKLTGDGCVTIGPTQVDSCANVLYCDKSFTKKDGTVTCG